MCRSQTVSIPIWRLSYGTKHLIKIKISVDVPLQSYVNENWRMNPFGKSFFFIASES